MQTFAQFYRKCGIHRWSEVANPRIFGFGEMDLPRDSIIHYIPTSETEYGIDTSDPVLAGTDRYVFVDHVRDLLEKEGSPRSTRTPVDSMVRRYHQRYRRFRRVKKLDTALRDSKSLVVMNYALLPHLYQYRPSIYARYYRWSNLEGTLWKTINDMGEVTHGKSHFVTLSLPKVLPTLQELRKAEDGNLDKRTLETFRSPRMFAVLDIWQWLGETRQNSKLSAVNPRYLDNINIILTAGTNWTVLNLGWLNKQRQPPEEEETGGIELENSKSPTQVQKHFLRSLMSLFESVTVAQDAQPQKRAEGEEIDEEQLEKDLEGLEAMRRTADQVSPAEGSAAQSFSAVSPESAVERQLQDLAERGLLSGADYRRLEKAIERSKNVENPYGEGTLAEFAQIDPEDLKLDEQSTVLADNIEGVLDKSMLKSSVSQFDPQYVDKVMRKDLIGMVLATQKSGAVVSGYKVKEVKDAINDYEVHSVRFTPVVGEPSTVHFRIPVVKPDGTYIANGVKYRMRKQRADTPIRKVSPIRVSLTSYYGKVFVERAERKKNNYDRWLTSRIIEMGLDDDNDTITKMRLVATFDHSLTLPRSYTAMAKKLKAFIAGEYEIYLDYNTRAEVYGEEKVVEAEAQGMVVVGRHKRSLLVMDSDSIIYRHTDKGPDVVGRIEELVGTDQMGEPPLEMAQLKLFNKNLPMGLVLGYLLGIGRLIEILELEPRVVEAGSRMGLGADEFAVRFKDESLIFSRNDPMAVLVFSGFDRFAKDVKRYSYREFNRKAVYVNVLESNGLQVRHARELDVLDSLFVDPITHELLKEIGEPETFIGLLFRSCELLLTDWHPDENDMKYQRIRGYERIPGAVYGELVRSMRSHNAKPNSPNKKIELNPEAVWLGLLKDPAKVSVEDSNPLQNLRHKEEITFSGVGGRTSESMVARTRVYHPNDMGVISESTKDSGDVAITTFASPDANFENLRGVTTRFDKSKDGASKLMSTSALNAPGADRDDQSISLET